MSLKPKEIKIIIILTINLNKNNTKLLILKNNNKVVKLPKNAPKIIRLIEEFRFNKMETPNNKRKSNIKFKNNTKST